MLKTVIERLQDYGRRLNASFAPNFERDMSNGLYFLGEKKPKQLTKGLYNYTQIQKFFLLLR